ncbi:MAG TPA: cyclic nucleotide-binding domain-containing protein [Terriglobales bacterium]|nr:cyclic nucleotide-binding domain-containing protein [Terriglobales bacterium]
MSSHDVAEFLRDVRLFQAFSDDDRAALARALRERTVRKGQVLFREGDQGAEMYLVRRGTLVVSKAVTGPVEQILARMGPGDFVGEMSLFDRAPRSATIQADAAADAALLVLDRASLETLIEANPRAAASFFHALVQVFIERMRASSDLVAEVTRWGLEATGLDVEGR